MRMGEKAVIPNGSEGPGWRGGVMAEALAPFCVPPARPGPSLPFGMTPFFALSLTTNVPAAAGHAQRRRRGHSLRAVLRLHLNTLMRSARRLGAPFALWILGILGRRAPGDLGLQYSALGACEAIARIQ